MKTIPAGRFKTHCLKVMDEVRARREPVIITKKGVPVVKLVPTGERHVDVFGCMVGTAEIPGVTSRLRWPLPGPGRQRSDPA